MFIIEVIPIGKGVIPASLSYFSHTAYARGTLLQIPVRKKSLPAIVTSSIDAFSMKTALRAATFSLRKLPTQETVTELSPYFFETAEAASLYHATTISAVLSGMLPKEIREGGIPIPTTALEKEEIPTHDRKPRVFAAPTHERFNEYGRMVRESFAAKKTVVFVAPTLEYVTQCKDALKKGIELYTLTLHGGQTPSALRKAYTTIATAEHPLLIITTPQYALVERPDIGTFVLEHERSPGYIGKTRPYLDYRRLLVTYATKRGSTIILADSIVRTEEIQALRSDQAITFTEPSKRLELSGVLAVISQEKSEDPDAFLLLTKPLIHALDIATKQKKHVFLFSARRGLAPLVACMDCGHILRDPESGAPLALSRTIKDGVESRWLTSAVSGYRIKAYDLCPGCGSWRLRERGIGIQQVYDELVKHYDRETILLCDHMTASTHKKASALRDRFYARPGGILLGTALALPYLTKPLGMSAVISQDSLRAIPSWRGQEEAFAILMTLREKTEGTVYVQTRTDDELFEFTKHGSVHDFYIQELAIREACNYPPYAVFIHFAWREKQKGLSPLKKMLADMFAENDISLYSSLDSTLKGAEGVVHYGLIRISSEAWPDLQLREKLCSLPPSVRIVINPDRIV